MVSVSVNRDAARISNQGGLSAMWLAKSDPLIIGLTKLPNSKWAKAHSAHWLAESLVKV